MTLGVVAGAIAATPAAAEAPAIRLAVVDAISSRKILPASPFGEFGSRKEIALSAARGEYEPASFVVRNDSAEPQTLHFAVDDLAGPDRTLDRSSIDLKHVIVWYQAAGAWTTWRKPRGNMDAFLTPELLVNDPELIRVDRANEHNYLRLSRKAGPEYLLISERKLNEIKVLPSVEEQPVYDRPTLQPISIPAGENRQVWLTLRVPEDAPPARYAGSIQILDAGGDRLGSIPLTLKVHRFELPAPRLEYGMYYRGKLADHNPTVSHEWKSAAQLIADHELMLAHGITNPTCYQRYRPKEDVERSSPVPSRELVAKYLSIRRELGLIGRPLYLIGRGIGKPSTAKQIRLLMSDTADLLALASAYGASELYLYGVDEALGPDIADQLAAWRAVKRAGAKVFVAGSADHFEHSEGLTDLLVYHGHPNREVAAKQHGVGNKTYKYSEPQAGPEDPLLWRKSFGIAIWQAGYDGAMPFAFQSQHGSIWNDWDGLNYRTLALAYPAADKPISTIAFEGLREAIDDVRYLTALEISIAGIERVGGAAEREDAALRQAAAFLEGLKDRDAYDPAEVRAEAVNHLEALSK